MTLPASCNGNDYAIYQYAFYNRTSLTSVTIPDSVTSIGGSAFYGCDNLIQKENGVHYVDKWVIDCDTDVTSVTLRADTVGIGDDAFFYCRNLTSVTIPDSVTGIGSRAFYNCSSLTSVTIGNGVTSIGDEAFYNCSSLASVTFENPNGWWTAFSDISATDLANISTAATYLKSTYCYCYWKRS